ncbi:dihydrolipoamide S-succinyltransferase, e2 component of oxoglutarate dehydrogenase complex Kdg2 [Schizosaccharomyces osmophilus]|uniref:dihydrolipoyllysine-residue succinyltransferase n=1 Tax=Schizosaccharomyces osmophilus TaxID=2545709 RepID=A0AAF0AV42_9SCHI|nr:dihydrolipoamide S-succinyltransferase, e2 component of oxoglutarate dehydrogenase complex Kdg2 [Schizosaccharomyces osmophilus]WBW72033.1 dihydrolipoamide S-succinyltransferase, e2 component of oxoglutarate dehydrogenase complex Kdg2 [Schizosaccharomyces osmophilus]
MPLTTSNLRCLSKLFVSLQTGQPAGFSLAKPAAHLVWRRFASTQIKTPPFPESISEGTLGQWLKQPGEYVNKDEEIASVETDKIDSPVTAPLSGVLKEHLVSEGDTITIDQNIAVLDDSAEAPKGGAAPPKPEAADSKPAKGGASEKTGASELGNAAESASSPSKPAPDATEPEKKPAPKREAPPKPVSKPSPPKPEFTASTATFSRNEERVKMNRMRLRIAERLKESQTRAASLTTFNECDMSAVINFRKQYKDEILKSSGVKLGFMSFFSKACTQAMKQVPAINGSIEGPGNGDTLVYRDFCDLSVAVATPKGLVTPVVRNAESLSLLALESAIANLGVKARDGKLAIEDMASGTFTISNGGVFGSLYGTPIINLPQTAVLGLHAVKDRAVVVNGQVVSRPMMYLALTYDHRMVDGREAVTFLRLVKEHIEDPTKMLLI